MALDESLLRTRLVDSGLYSTVERVDSVSSTNQMLLEAAAAEGFDQQWPHGSVLTAEEQTAGRGRLGRAWSSAPGATLSTSLVLHPSLPADQRHWLILAAGLALVSTLRERGIAASLKWPNDVLIGGQKIAGLLGVVPPQRPQLLILGCGINVLQQPEELPTDRATSVLAEYDRAGRTAPQAGTAEAESLRTILLTDWLTTFAYLLRQVQGEGDIDPIRADIIAAISTIGQQVRIELPDRTGARGEASGVDDDGALEVRVTHRRATTLDAEAGGGDEELWSPVPTPVTESFTAGDVVHLRSD